MIRQTIIAQMESFREWRWTESDDDKVARRFAAIHDQCESVDECRYVVREFFKAKAKDTPGPDAARRLFGV